MLRLGSGEKKTHSRRGITLKVRNGRNCLEFDKETAALEKVDEAIRAVEGCDGALTAEGYVELRKRLGQLMDALYKVGGRLSKAT